MDVIIQFANSLFKPLVDLGAAPLMFILLSLLAMLMRVKPSSAIEGGLKLAIALTGIGRRHRYSHREFCAGVKGFCQIDRN